MTTVPNLTLNDGNAIPQLGFGVFQIPPEDTAEAVRAALAVGYRHIDTAEMYGNEAGVGDGDPRGSGVDRAEVYVTSKLNNGFHAPDDARRAFETTLAELGIDYVDLFLIHWPLPTLLRRRLRLDLADARGVQGRRPRPLDRRLELPGRAPGAAGRRGATSSPPSTRSSCTRTSPTMRCDAYGAEHGIATEAWSPIAQGGVLDDPVITEIAERLGRTPAQVVLRWHIERGNIVFPKSTTPERIEENFALFDFELEPGDDEAIAGLDRGEDGRTGPNPDVDGLRPALSEQPLGDVPQALGVGRVERVRRDATRSDVERAALHDLGLRAVLEVAPAARPRAPAPSRPARSSRRPARAS